MALVVRLMIIYGAGMSTVAEIQAALSNLSPDELRTVELALQRQFRDRKLGILYDDSYGIWTEADQLSAAGEVFAVMDDERSHDPAAR